jgi:hypothetical protein
MSHVVEHVVEQHDEYMYIHDSIDHDSIDHDS